MIHSRLDEYTRKRLLDKSKKDTPEKFARRTEIQNSEWSLMRVGLLELLATEDLYIYFKVRDYRVDLRIIGFKPILNQYLTGKFSKDIDKAITRALNHCLRYNHIQLKCSCPDFRYRYAYMATIKGYGFDVDENRPANITNPNNRGGICKHAAKILNSPSLWSKRVVTVIKQYVRKRKEGE